MKPAGLSIYSILCVELQTAVLMWPKPVAFYIMYRSSSTGVKFIHAWKEVLFCTNTSESRLHNRYVDTISNLHWLADYPAERIYAIASPTDAFYAGYSTEATLYT